MYFPVILMREFGVWGWMVFAIPNVIGSAIAGAVLRSADRSKKLLSQHAPAAIAFSLVTIAFHVFFVGWKLLPLVGLVPATGVFLLAGIFFGIGGGTRRDLILAVIVIALSLVAMGFALTQPLGNGTLFARADPSPSLIALTPVCMIGFFLCPYLDLTYHRARQNTAPAAGEKAFQIGFAGPFLAMILFTMLYAGWLDRGPGENLVLRYAVGIHMIVQIAFTLSLHVRSLLDATAKQHKRWRLLLPTAALAAIALALLTLNFPFLIWRNLTDFSTPRAHDTGEVIYLCFMGFYGALFPAYVLLCMVPTGANPAAPTPARIARVLITGGIAIAFYWLGLVEHATWWLLGGVAVILASRRMLPKSSS